MTSNKTLGKVVGVLSLGLGAVLVSVIVKVQTDPLAFTRQHKTIEIKSERLKKETPVVVEEKVTVIELEPMVVRARPKMGAAYVKKPAKKPCKLAYHVVGYTDSSFKNFRGVWSCDPVK